MIYSKQAIRDYWPLMVLIGVSLLGALATGGGMAHIMGFALLIFAVLKLFTPSKFADGFQMYDVLARRFRPYAYVYPYIELGLALAYLAPVRPPIVYWMTIGVFTFGALGVLTALKRGLKINCPCMGNVLKVPLSTVTLVEDLSMVAMAAWMLAGL